MRLIIASDVSLLAHGDNNEFQRKSRLIIITFRNVDHCRVGPVPKQEMIRTTEKYDDQNANITEQKTTSLSLVLCAVYCMRVRLWIAQHQFLVHNVTTIIRI